MFDRHKKEIDKKIKDIEDRLDRLEGLFFDVAHALSEIAEMHGKDFRKGFVGDEIKTFGWGLFPLEKPIRIRHPSKLDV